MNDGFPSFAMSPSNLSSPPQEIATQTLQGPFFKSGSKNANALQSIKDSSMTSL